MTRPINFIQELLRAESFLYLRRTLRLTRFFFNVYVCMQVFFNEAQVVNRDVSIAAIRVYDELVKKEAEEQPRKKRRRMAKANDESKGDEQKGDVEGLKILEGLSASGA